MYMDNTRQLEIKNIVIDFLMENYLYWSDQFNVDHSQSLMEEGIVDSTGLLELSSFLESRFNITIEDNEFTPENLDTLDNISTFVMKKNGAPSPLSD